jgi:anti-anti-sigma regulatory factor
VGVAARAGVPGPDLVVTGRLTARTGRSLHGRLRRLVRDGAREVRVDLRGVEQAEPAAVAVLLVYARLLPPLGGRLVLTGASDAVAGTLTGMGFAHLLGPAGTPAP